MRQRESKLVDDEGFEIIARLCWAWVQIHLLDIIQREMVIGMLLKYKSYLRPLSKILIETLKFLVTIEESMLRLLKHKISAQNASLILINLPHIFFLLKMIQFRIES